MQNRRREWFAGQLDLDPTKLVFIDETGASTNLARKSGRCRRGRRLRAAIPHSHYKTVTLIAGLRLRGLTAARTFDGPINAALFEDWVETCLVPTLSPGEIVVMDNLPAHKGPRVEQLIKAAGAQLRTCQPQCRHEPDRKSLLQAQGLPAQNRRTDRRWSAARPRNLRRNLQALGMYKLLQILRLSGRYRMIGLPLKCQGTL